MQRKRGGAAILGNLASVPPKPSAQMKSEAWAVVSGSNPERHPGTDLLMAVDNMTVRSEEQRWALAKKRLDLLFKQVEFIDTTQQHVKVAEMWHEQVPSMGVVSELFNEKHHNDIVWDDEFLQSPHFGQQFVAAASSWGG